MFALILESLSSTELLFILVIALVFFGPRKLPQLARSMGKGLAEFRKASDDFKRTWEREVAMEAAKLETEANSIFEEQPQALLEEKLAPESLAPESLVQSADPELVVARGSASEPVAHTAEPLAQSAEPLTEAEPLTVAAEPTAPEPLRKQEWI